MSKKSRLSTEPYKGVRDFYPEDQSLMRYICDIQKEVVEQFGYEEYHASILESSELYQGKTSEEIVNEQVYSFTDRGGRDVTLRPEMTPTVARMVSAKRRELGFPLRLYSIPNVFRYERPQHGRLREHWQLNVDLLGSRSPRADMEMIEVAHAIMLRFGAKESDFTIQVGSRTFINGLVKKLDLSEDKAKVLRNLLDKRDKISSSEFEFALEGLGASLEMISPSETPLEVSTLLDLLSKEGITNAFFAPHIVRGFDYYTDIVFEIFDTDKSNPRSLFGGGRYDNLLQYFDDDQIPAIGFGMGDVTIRNFLISHNLLPQYHPKTLVYIAVVSSLELTTARIVANELRSKKINTAIDFGEKHLSDQIRTAHKHKIQFIIIIGEKEVRTDIFTVRNLKTGQENSIARKDLIDFFKVT